jgi:hypothetical protein
MNEVAWKNLEAEKAHRQPTPPIGKPVVWYIEGDKTRAVAAQVTGIESPGRVKLVAFPLNAFPQHKSGVYHVSAELHQKANNPTTKNCGSWDYVDEEDCRVRHYDLHKAELEKRELGLMQAEEQAKANEALFIKRAQEKAAGIKKRLPDPLPAK